MKQPELSILLTYTNPHILKRYEKDYPNNQLKAEEALQELLKFFWLSQQHKLEQKIAHDNNKAFTVLNFQAAIHEEMKEIDDMWHTFLLFTQEYMDFCEHYFGHFIHHSPTTDESETPSPEQYEKDLENYLSYIYDRLGEETVRKWFNEY